MASIINSTTTAGVTVTGDNSGSLQLATNNGTTAVTIDTSQNVGIGTASPATKVEIQSGAETLRLSRSTSGSVYLGLAQAGTRKAYLESNNADLNLFAEAASSNLIFGTVSTERMRIDSSGNVLVGATSAATPTGVTSKFVSQGNFTGSTFGAAISSTAATGVDHYYISFQTATTTQRGYIYYNNGAGQVQLSATSDIRLKENIVDAPSALPILNQVKVRQYDWKDTGNTNIGFVAQELYDVIPRAVAVGEDNEDGTIQRTWGVDNGTLVPYLVKAIQELNAKVDAQAVRIAELEGAK